MSLLLGQGLAEMAHLCSMWWQLEKLDPDLKDGLSNGLNYLGHDLKVESFMKGKTCGKRGSRP